MTTTLQATAPAAGSAPNLARICAAPSMARRWPVRTKTASTSPRPCSHGLDTLRFVKPVGIGDTIRARLMAKRKIHRNRKDAKGVGQGVVAWDVEVTNQDGALVASYDILTLVAKES